MLQSKGGDLSSYFDKAGENVLDNKNISKQILVENHDEEANRGKIKGQLVLESVFLVSI